MGGTGGDGIETNITGSNVTRGGGGGGVRRGDGQRGRASDYKEEQVAENRVEHNSVTAVGGTSGTANTGSGGGGGGPSSGSGGKGVIFDTVQ